MRVSKNDPHTRACSTIDANGKPKAKNPRTLWPEVFVFNRATSTSAQSRTAGRCARFRKCSTHSRVRSQKEKPRCFRYGAFFLIGQLPTLPHTRACSTIGAGRLNFRVRDGNGWDPLATITQKSYKLLLLQRAGCIESSDSLRLNIDGLCHNFMTAHNALAGCALYKHCLTFSALDSVSTVRTQLSLSPDACPLSSTLCIYSKILWSSRTGY